MTITIVAVHKDSDGNIESVKTEYGTIFSKSSVIYLITNEGDKFKTKDFLGHEADVHIYNDKWLRTDKNNNNWDNLGNLPTF